MSLMGIKKDFLGNEINLGDEVVFVQIGYRNLMKGTIIKMSEHKCTLSHDETNTCSTKSIQFHNQVIKIK